MRKILICLIGITIFNVSLSLSLREEAEIDFNFIDRVILRMQEEDGSTYGLRRAMAVKYGAMDDLLNKYYKKLLNNPSLSGQKKEIIEAQKEWIKLRDKEFEVYDSYFYKREGSAMPILADDLKIEFLKNRILEFVALSGYTDS